MLDALQLDVYGYRAHAPNIVTLTVDVRAGEPFPAPRHVFYGATEDDALRAFNAHCDFDDYLRRAVEQDAITSKFREIEIYESHYPLVRHVFYGVTREEAEARCELHADQCRFLKPKIASDEADLNWRELPFRDKESLTP